MTAERLRRRVGFVVAGLAVLIAAAIVFKATGHDEVYTTIKELSPLVIAILAAYLASRFQARAAFHASLRDVWSHLIEAKNELVAYTMDPSPERYVQAYKQLSKAIDEVRGVYLNVGEDERHRGWYPYQPLHDMLTTLEDLGPSPYAAKCLEAKDQIEQAWNALRPNFLAEFEPPEPTDPIIHWGARDRRKKGSAPKHGWRLRLTRIARQ
jgi:hypothetical protein